MNRFLIPLGLCAVLIAGCKSANVTATPSPTSIPQSSATDVARIVGLWKVDVSRTTIPLTSDKEKAAEAEMRLQFNPDQTFSTSGNPNPVKGTWSIEGSTVKLKDEKSGAPPLLTLSPDATSLTATTTDRGKSLTLFLIKA